MNKEIEEAAEIIKKGGIVIFPTETVYGIGVDGLNEEAVKKLYDIKQRDVNKPISLLVSDMEMVEKVAKDITKIEYEIMKQFFPGPLTIILKKKDCVPDCLAAKDKTVGIRMPMNDVARQIVKLSKTPIATPSANISGKPAGIDIEEIKKDFDNKVDFIIDGGRPRYEMASTIVKVVDDVPIILRKGKITEEQIMDVIKKIKE